jgi:hypothetical protein
MKIEENNSMEPVYIKKNILGTFYYKDKQMQISHRTDGPAKEWFTGVKAYYLNGDWIRDEETYKKTLMHLETIENI